MTYILERLEYKRIYVNACEMSTESLARTGTKSFCQCESDQATEPRVALQSNYELSHDFQCWHCDHSFLSSVRRGFVARRFEWPCFLSLHRLAEGFVHTTHKEIYPQAKKAYGTGLLDQNPCSPLAK